MNVPFDITRVLVKAAAQKIQQQGGTKAPAIPAGVPSPASTAGAMPTLGGLQGMAAPAPSTPQMTAGDAARSSGQSLIGDANTVRRTAMENAPMPAGGPNIQQVLGGLLATVLAGDQAPEVLGGLTAGFQQGMQTTDARNQKAFENQRMVSELEAMALENEGKFRLDDAARLDGQAQQAANRQFDLDRDKQRDASAIELENVRGKNRANVENIKAESKEDSGLLTALTKPGQSPEMKMIIADRLRQSNDRFKNLSDQEIEAIALSKDATMIRADAATTNADANKTRSDAAAKLSNARADDIKFMQPFKKMLTLAQVDGQKALGESRRASASLSKVRAQYYGKEADARIKKLEADAEKARQAANQKAPYKTQAWVQRGMYMNQQAFDKASSYLSALDVELKGVDGRIASLNAELSKEKVATRSKEIGDEIKKLENFKIESARNQAYWTAVKTNAEGRMKEYQAQIEKGDVQPVPDAKELAGQMIEQFNSLGLTGKDAEAQLKKMNDKFYELYGERPFSAGGK